MTRDALRERIQSRITDAGLDVPHAQLELLTAYVRLLDRWNRKINLTAFDLDAPSDAAIDRLIVEPVAAARFLRPDDRAAIDIGSGGGSPALPLKITTPHLDMVLFEARVRKAAFLREAIRELQLSGAEVVTGMFGRTPNISLVQIDMATIRGVRLDRDLLDSIARALGSDGRLFAFGASSPEVAKAVPGSGFRPVSGLSGLPAGLSSLQGSGRA